MNLPKIRAKLRDVFRSGLVKDTLWMLLSKFLTIGIQAGYFIIVARVLGAEHYGSFIGVTALASIIFPFVALGCEHLLIKNVAIDRSLFNLYWGNACLLLLVNGTFFTVLLTGLSPLFFHETISSFAVFLILIADLIFLSMLDISSKALMSVYLVSKSAQLYIFGTVTKLVAALALLVFFPHANTLQWAYLYLAASAIIGITGVVIVSKVVGLPKPILSKAITDIKEGVYFAISSSAQNINSSMDKTMLASLSTLNATGIYGAAYRFLDVGYSPLFALAGAAYTRFFEHGASGIKNSLGFAKRLLPVISAYSIASLVGYFILAPFIPAILGEEYREAIAALHWLAPLTAIAAFQYLAADTLTGAGYQKIRSMIQVSAALLNILLNFWLIPLHSWRGAAWATLISDSLRLICLWLVVFIVYRRAKQEKLG
jgi:O-antigen/teichoic acid export membrane protein